VPSGGSGARAAAVARVLAHVSPAALRLLLAQPNAVPLGLLERVLQALASLLHELLRTAAARGRGAPWMPAARTDGMCIVWHAAGEKRSLCLPRATWLRHRGRLEAASIVRG